VGRDDLTPYSRNEISTNLLPKTASDITSGKHFSGSPIKQVGLNNLGLARRMGNVFVPHSEEKLDTAFQAFQGCGSLPRLGHALVRLNVLRFCQRMQEVVFTSWVKARHSTLAAASIVA
jgi:hypothetical protein